MANNPAIPQNSPFGVFGVEVRRHREKAELSQRELARRISYSEQTVGMIENGHRRPVDDFAERCDEVFGTEGLFIRLWTLARNVNPVGWLGWFAEYLEAEQQAVSLRIWENEWIPGLFQTEDYAREIITAYRTHDPAGIEKWVTLRMERQRIVLGPDGPDIWMLLGEGALRRPVGGAQVWRAQLEHFVSMVESSHRWIVQVLPFAAGAHALSDGAVNIVSFADGPDQAYADGPGVGLMLDRAGDVRDCRFRFDHDRTKALSPSESVEFINDLIKDIP
jgi:transcriptional regulator with XRE-family HTH domain